MSPLSLLLLVICHHQSAFLINEKPLAGLYQQLEGWLAGLALPSTTSRLPTRLPPDQVGDHSSREQALCLLHRLRVPLPRTQGESIRGSWRQPWGEKDLLQTTSWQARPSHHARHQPKVHSRPRTRPGTKVQNFWGSREASPMKQMWEVRR